MTRSSANWHSKPGSFDTVHAQMLFPSNNSFGIPALRHTPVLSVPAWLAPYRTRIRSKTGVAGGAVHFFLDDYRFETVWTRPHKALSALRPYDTLLTPDFSLFSDWPLAIQLWNTYRNRWCGAFWQSRGFMVIPTVSWSAPASYDFCFCGIPPRSLVAVSTVGARKRSASQFFIAGFGEMVRRLEPSLVLCYGEPLAGMEELATLKVYPDRWAGIRQARKGAT